MRVACLFAVALWARGADLAAPASPVAWVRFAEAPEAYQGTNYHWLGTGDLALEFNVPAQAGLSLEILWGAKNDTRTASLVVNGGRTRLLESGGYDGFRWLRVPLAEPSSEGKLRVDFRPVGGRAAFIAEVRVTSEEAGPAGADLTATTHQAKVVSGPADSGVLTRMRQVWDRPRPEEQLPGDAASRTAVRLAEAHARQASESLFRCRHFVRGWLAVADPRTGLIPENLGQGRDRWNGRNNAADNYPYMVLSCALTDRPVFEGRMREMLRTETELTRRLDRLGDWYQFSKQGFEHDAVDLERLVFDNAEYVKDGLIPVTEWLGPTAWSERMIGLTEDIWKHASVETPFGKIPTLNFEVNGDLLQACSRLYWFTGRSQYLDWASRLGDYYLLGTNHPTRDLEKLSLGDHSCEVINGLSELYVAVAHARPEKREAYRAPLHALYNRILEIGVNEHGMMYRQVNTRTGEHGPALTDNWGYNYDGFYTVWLLDREPAYRAAVIKALSNLKEHYSSHVWEGGSADGYADSIEGAITLLNREPVDSAGEWVDSQIKVMWSKQRPDGIIEGWHGDGNSARTAIMYALMKSQGATLQPWREDVRLGAVRQGRAVWFYLEADAAWDGRLFFDRPRHREYLKLPIDYPRINQFPEWFTVERSANYQLGELGGKSGTRKGAALLKGWPVQLRAGEARVLVVEPASR